MKVISFSRTMTEKGRQVFEEENRATPSVTAPGETNLSDATDHQGNCPACLFLNLSLVLQLAAVLLTYNLILIIQRSEIQHHFNS